MAERALAHIEKIGWIKPIEGKDRIALAGVLDGQLSSRNQIMRLVKNAYFVKLILYFQKNQNLSF